MIGAAVGGMAGAVWADRDNDGRVDGYVYNGQYYRASRAVQHTQRIAQTETIVPISPGLPCLPPNLLRRHSQLMTAHYVIAPPPY